MTLKAFVTAAVLALAALAADATAQTCPAAPAVTGDFAPQGIDVSTISKTIRPGDDFFAYVNQGWIDRTPIPAGYWDYGQTNVLMKRVDEQIRDVLAQSLRSGAPHGSPRQQIGDTYASFLDTAAIEARGLKPFRPGIKAIMTARTPADIARVMADPTSSTLFAINLFPAEGQWRVHLDQQNQAQPMLGLFNRDAYEKTDPDSMAGRAAYEDYIAGLFERAGVANARARAGRVLALETRIAANLWDFNRLRDRRANYHPMTVAELEAYAPGFPWRAYLKARGVGQVSEVVLGTDTAAQAQAKLFAATPLDDWRSYIVFHWLQNQIDVMPEAFRETSWNFYGKTLWHAKSPQARPDEALQMVNRVLGQQLGRLYAERYVSAETRAAAQEMIAYLRKAMAERLKNAEWMDAATRTEALAKLDAFSFKVGYPSIWRDYSGLDVRRDDAAGNLRRIRAADWAYQRRRLDPGARDEPWYQTPQTVDASYSVLFNAIELPGAFLQPPYFDAHADPAVNFGAIGGIIGHEMGHGFDDQGIIYDAHGRMRNWWSQGALDAFHARTRALVDQYDAFRPYPDIHVDGQRTIGENIADLSGLSLAWTAYHLYLADHPCAKARAGDGLGGGQRFFLAWTQAWRYRAPESAIRYVVGNSYHSPTPYRVNGVVQNLEAWYDAFGVRPGDALYRPPEDRVRIW